MAKLGMLKETNKTINRLHSYIFSLLLQRKNMYLSIILIKQSLRIFCIPIVLSLWEITFHLT